MIGTRFDDIIKTYTQQHLTTAIINLTPVGESSVSVMTNENYLAMTEGVKTFLEKLGLMQYYDMFLAKGFDSEDDLCYLNGADLDTMYIDNEAHRTAIIRAG